MRALVVSVQIASSAAGPHRHTLLNFALVLLFPFHPPVLEPYLDLPLGETQGMGNFNSSSAGQVAVEVKLLLQFQRLVPSIRLTASLAFCNMVK